MNEFFTEKDVISKYTEDQAIEDGVKADLGWFPFGKGLVRITATTGFINTMNSLQTMHILLKTLNNIQSKYPNMIVFQRGEGGDRRQDEGRTLITYMKLEKKVYAILDDHGSHYVLTFLLAEEY